MIGVNVVEVYEKPLHTCNTCQYVVHVRRNFFLRNPEPRHFREEEFDQARDYLVQFPFEKLYFVSDYKLCDLERAVRGYHSEM